MADLFGGEPGPPGPTQPPTTPTTPTPPPSTPPGTPPANPNGSPIPNFAQYMGDDAAALKAYQDALAQINYNRQQLLKQNGYMADINPTSGVTTNLRVDPFNQYGGYQMMLGNQAEQDMSAVDDSTGRGLFGGLAHQAANGLRFQHGAEDSQFGQTMLGNIQGLLSQQQSAWNTYQNVLWQDKLAAMMAAIAAGNFGPGGGGGGGDTSATSTDPAGFAKMATWVNDNGLGSWRPPDSWAPQQSKSKTKSHPPVHGGKI